MWIGAAVTSVGAAVLTTVIGATVGRRRDNNPTAWFLFMCADLLAVGAAAGAAFQGSRFFAGIGMGWAFAAGFALAQYQWTKEYNRYYR